MKNESELDPLALHLNLDYSKSVRGKYFDRLKQGTNIVLIPPDLLDTFPDSESVNEALRSLKKIAARTATPPPQTRDRLTPPPAPSPLTPHPHTPILTTIPGPMRIPT